MIETRIAAAARSDAATSNVGRAPDATDFVAIIADLGAEIARVSASAGIRGSAFAAVCAAALERRALHRAVTPSDILRWLVTTDAVPEQGRSDDSFGQPSLTLFHADRFRIDALFWHTGTTAIHQHGFAGAFAVLAGSSLQSTFSFHPEDAGDPRFVTGTLTLRASELLQCGAVRRIDPGEALIHSLFHLDMPSVTLVVRTHHEEEHGPEYVYYPPGLAVDPTASGPLTKKRLQALDLLIRVNAPDLTSLALDLVSYAPIETVFEALFTLRVKGSRAFEPALTAAAARFPRHTPALTAAIQEESRRALIAHLRRLVGEPDHRLFLALLMNVSTRESILDLVRTHAPGDDAVETIVRWSREIASIPRAGLDGLGLDTIGPDRDGAGLAILRWTLTGLTRDEILLRASDASIAAALDRLRAHYLFLPLFASSARANPARPLSPDSSC